MTDHINPLAGFQAGDTLTIKNLRTPERRTFRTVEGLVLYLRRVQVRPGGAGSAWEIKHKRNRVDVSADTLFPMAVLDAYRGQFMRQA
jgi:hypothetical protein